jgi:Kef-type K+ transport system membrane component KefB
MYLLNTGINSDLSIIIVNLGIIIIMGYIFGKLFEYIKVPAVTGYLVAGLVLGPITGYLSSEDLSSFQIVSDIALGFIAFQVGNELWFGKLKKSGVKIVVITIIQAVLTTAIVIFATSFVVDLSVALILGAVAAATAPAPIMLIIKKYKAKGELTDTIIPVVGLDDAVGVVMFSALMSISIALLSTSGAALNVITMFKEPFIEILLSIVMGGGIGLIAGLTIRKIQKQTDVGEQNLQIVVIAVLMTTGTALLLGGSPILTPMIAGTVVTNLINKECYILEEETIRFFIPPIMLVFFTVAGAQLNFKVVLSAGVVGLLYIVGRAIGKFIGSYIGCSIMKTSTEVRKYLGVSLLPQSGVAIGLSVAAFRLISPVNLIFAEQIQNVILASVLFFALTGPILVKIALTLSGDIKETVKVTETIHGKEASVEWTNSKVLSQ